MIVDTFAELEDYFKAFAEGHFDLLIVISKGGLGKSFTANKYIHDKVVFKGHSTPLAIFLTLQRSPDKVVLLDDVDTLADNKLNVSLLKQLTDSNSPKMVHYHSTTELLQGVDKSFISRNRLCCLFNDVKRVGKNLAALFTRGVLVDFVPSKGEVLERIKSVFCVDDGDVVFSFIYSNVGVLYGFNLRTYVRACELRLAGLDWKKWLLEEFRLDIPALLVELKGLPVGVRNKLWVSCTGKSVRSLHRYLSKRW